MQFFIEGIVTLSVNYNSYFYFYLLNAAVLLTKC